MKDKLIEVVFKVFTDIEKMTLSARYALLEEILTDSLQYLIRWGSVQVIKPGDDFPKSISRGRGNPKDFFYIAWTDPKTEKNTNEFETKRVPVRDLNTEIVRQLINNIQGRPLNKEMD